MKHKQIVAILCSAVLSLGCISLSACSAEVDIVTQETDQEELMPVETESNPEMLETEDVSQPEEVIPSEEMKQPQETKPTQEPEPPEETKPPQETETQEETEPVQETQSDKETDPDQETETQVDTELSEETEFLETEPESKPEAPVMDQELAETGETEPDETDKKCEESNHETETIPVPEDETTKKEDNTSGTPKESEGTVEKNSTDTEEHFVDQAMKEESFVNDDASTDQKDSFYVPDDFRFCKVDKTYGLAESVTPCYFYASANDNSKVVGKLQNFGLAYLLEEAENGYLYMESGMVRGFVKADTILQGEYVNQVIDTIGEDAFTLATPYCEIAENSAFTYTHTTTQEVVAKKEYALILQSVPIYEYETSASRAIGEAVSGNLVYLLAQAENGWYFVESGDVRGFVDPVMLLTGVTAKEVVAQVETEDEIYVTECVLPCDNRSCYYTLRSVETQGQAKGKQIASYATEYVGKLPYIYGGTSLSSGADCSGFVQSVYARFGISLPRTAQEQGASGMAIASLSDAMAGDLIYWSSGPHIGIYLGDGKVAQCSGNASNTAANPGRGVTISDAAYMPITAIRRYVAATKQKEKAVYQKDTNTYTKDQMELIWAIVAQEDNGSYEGALAVISSAMNRTQSAKWSYCGSDALSQLTASGQYCYSLDHYWESRLNGNVPDYVKQAVYDCLEQGIRNHAYTSFRSTQGKVTGSDAVQIGGNWFFGS